MWRRTTNAAAAARLMAAPRGTQATPSVKGKGTLALHLRLRGLQSGAPAESHGGSSGGVGRGRRVCEKVRSWTPGLPKHRKSDPSTSLKMKDRKKNAPRINFSAACISVLLIASHRTPVHPARTLVELDAVPAIA